MNTQHIRWVGLLFAAALVGYGCADLKTELPAPVEPGVQAHGSDWIDTSSSNFHGKALQAAPGDVDKCLSCHGLDYQGGFSGVSCVACHKSTGATLHGRGWTNPASANFHGNTIRAANWDMRSCQTCHGTSYSGGKVNSSCRDCHNGAGGPEGCATCHGSANPAPPRDLAKNTSRSARGVGAHQIHVAGSPVSGTMFCNECHAVPGAIYSPGHIDATTGAEVVFNNTLASTVTNRVGTIDYDPELPTYTPSPSHSQTALTCSNTYCHGYFKNGNQNVAPVWNDTTGTQGACGTCHGDVTKPLNTVARSIPRTTAQGGTHPDLTSLGISCNVCHGDVVDANYRIIDKEKHINGKLNVLGEERTW